MGYAISTLTRICQVYKCSHYCQKAGRAYQLHVAQRLKRPQPFVSKYESGERRLDVLEFIQICKAMKADALEILKNAGLLK